MKRDVRKLVRSKYAHVARSGLSTRQRGIRTVAKAFGYSAKELASIPAEANMGLSCGNPTAFASLRPGEVVVDLGCGGGLDVLLAARKVGPKGKAIGVDMTRAMIDLARRNAAKAGKGKSPKNIEFHLATIDQLPLPDASVDVVISNCVINLAPDKPAVFREIARVLRPGGRLAASDIALKKRLPARLAFSVAAYTGCIAGAIPVARYRQGLAKAGLKHVQVVDSGADLNAYAEAGDAACCGSPPDTKKRSAASSCCGNPPSGTMGRSRSASVDLHDEMADLVQHYDLNDYAGSYKIFAVKP